ncbi:hypothetical protein D3C75_1299410 [compost metagenome]
MQRRYTIDAVAAHDSEMCHSNLIMRNNRQMRYTFLISGISIQKHAAEALVNLFNNHVDPWQQLANHGYRPFF